MTITATSGPRGKQFDIEIEQAVTAADLNWPWGAESQAEGLGWNSDYWRLRRISWGRVRTTIIEERDVVDRLSSTPDELAAYDLWCENRIEGDAEYLIGLDLGTNSLVAALRAGRFLPFYSCNGGAFGIDHGAPLPTVFFLCRRKLLPFVEQAARVAEVTLEANLAGGISAYARNVDAFINMAEELYLQREAMAAVALPRLVRPSSRLEDASADVEDDRQLCLL